MYISDPVFNILLIFTILVTLTILFVITYYTAWTSAPTTLHTTFTTENSSSAETVSVSQKKKKKNLSMFSDDFIYESELQYTESYDYDSNNSWALWQLVRLTSHTNTQEMKGNCVSTLSPQGVVSPQGECKDIAQLPDYDPPEYIIGASQNGKERRMGILFHQPTKQLTVLAFNGTSSPGDWRTDMDLNLISNNIRNDIEGGKIHRGFRNSYLTLADGVKKLIEKYNPKTREGGWYITGHSLGGAIATLVAYDQISNFNSQPHVYTYGQPRIGDTDFSNALNDLYKTGAYRIVNTSDIITDLPPPIWFNKNVYEHGFSERHFTDNTTFYSKNHIQSYQNFLKENA